MMFYQWLNESFSSFQYKFPHNKQNQMFDFFTFSILHPFLNQPHYSERDEMLAHSLKETGNILINGLKSELVIALFDSISYEFRHVFDKYGIETFFELPSMLMYDLVDLNQVNLIELYKDKFDHVDVSRSKGLELANVVSSKYGMANFIKMTHTLFSHTGIWEEGYGGKTWAAISNAWLKLYYSKNINDMIIWIDHIYDLQHNNGTIFDKLERYKQNNSYLWIDHSLSFKFNAKSVYELLDYTSADMRKLALAVTKASDGSTLEKHQKKNVEYSIFSKMDGSPILKLSRLILNHALSNKPSKLIDVDWINQFSYGKSAITTEFLSAALGFDVSPDWITSNISTNIKKDRHIVKNTLAEEIKITREISNFPFNSLNDGKIIFEDNVARKSILHIANNVSLSKQALSLLESKLKSSINTTEVEKLFRTYTLYPEPVCKKWCIAKWLQLNYKER